MPCWTEWTEIEGLRLRLTAGGSGLLEIRFCTPDDPPGAAEARDDSHPVLRETARQLREYFEGARREFTVPIEMTGTAFQQRVWRMLLTIPYGETRSYQEIAGSIGAPRAVRAVGAANGTNPIPIIVPCHRVIGSNGKLTGYGGGLPLKRWLLDLEQGAGHQLCPSLLHTLSIS